MQKINELTQKEMTRKEFLQTLGFGAAAVLGFSSVFRLLGSKSHTQQSGYGYGGGAYGGLKKTT